MVSPVLVVGFLICCAIVAFIFFMGNIIERHARFSSHPDPGKLSIFAQGEDIRRVIRSSPFFDSMTPNDLSARGMPTRSEYRRIYQENIRVFTREETVRIRSIVAQASSLLSPFRNIASIPWKIAKMDQSIENGWSHTLGHIIMLNETALSLSDKDLLRTLIHEQIHVYQRKYRDETSRFISITPYKVYAKRNAFHLLANNPDTDDFVYTFRDDVIYLGHQEQSPRENAPVIWYQGPGNSMRQIVPQELGLDPAVSQVDHPYEFMAGYLAAVLVYDIPSILPDIRSWMGRYL